MCAAVQQLPLERCDLAWAHVRVGDTTRPHRRFRAQKLKYAISDARKDSMRLAFGKEDGEYGDSVMGLTTGLLGAKSGSGRIRAPRKKKEKRQGEGRALVWHNHVTRVAADRC